MSLTKHLSMPADLFLIIDLPAYEPTPEQDEFEEWLKSYVEANYEKIIKDYDRYSCMLPENEV